MQTLYYVGLDIHKKTISYCVKTPSGEIVQEGRLRSTRNELERWHKTVPKPWVAAMEATLFTGWIYDFLTAAGAVVKVANPSMLKAIATSKKKNDQVDARTIADMLRCDLIAECYMAPAPLRELRRILRYRNLLMRQCVQTKNRLAGLLMETGVEYDKGRLHGRQYFKQLLDDLQPATPDSLVHLLKLSRGNIDALTRMERQLVRGLLKHAQLRARVERLMSIPAVGQITALSWVLEVGEPQRFPSVKHAISYCGLCSGQNNSAGKEHRGPISKQRNHHLQWVLVEAAKLAPRWNPVLAQVHAQALERGDRNQATLAVARKLVAYLLAVDRSQQPFQMRATHLSTPATAA